MLKGRTAVVTGASRGIGAAIAEKLASSGASIAILDIGNMEKADAVKAEIMEKYNVKAEVYCCDVTDGDACTACVKKIVEEFGKIDILVNNAGITRDALIVTMEEENFEKVVDTNLKGTFNMIKACGRNFIRNRYGKIINIASISGIVGTAGQANYAASKAGVIALTKVTARELAAKNVCCNAIAPGFIETDMTKDLQNGKEYLKSIPLKRAGTPEDIAKVALFLASENADYITGEVIRVDGGLAI